VGKGRGLFEGFSDKPLLSCAFSNFSAQFKSVGINKLMILCKKKKIMHTAAGGKLIFAVKKLFRLS
jgi:hypothetical protein